tara:strand:+ start:1038 stop:1871 length:834 start_codon:yes stop_codon:yes gene_type:complete
MIMNKESLVILSVYKNDLIENLMECMESIFSQSYKSYEIYVQEDGIVKQDVHNYLQELLKKEKISHLGTRKENRGLAFSLNELIRLGMLKNFEYYFRMDADDICTFDRFSKQISFLKSNSSISVCGGLIEEFNTENDFSHKVDYPKDDFRIKQKMVLRNSMAHVTTCLRKQFFEIVGLYDETKKNEDYDLWIRAIGENINFGNIDSVLVKVRVDNNFYNRRRDHDRAKELLLLKIKCVNILKLTRYNYIYAFGQYLVFMSPSFIKKFLYKNIRKYLT